MDGVLVDSEEFICILAITSSFSADEFLLADWKVSVFYSAPEKLSGMVAHLSIVL